MAPRIQRNKILGDAPNLTTLVDNSGGTASSTIAAQTGAYVQATQQNTIASLVAAINAINARLNGTDGQ